MIVAVRAAVLVAVSIYRISPLGFFVGPEAERYVKWSYLQ